MSSTQHEIDVRTLWRAHFFKSLSSYQFSDYHIQSWGPDISVIVRPAIGNLSQNEIEQELLHNPTYSYQDDLTLETFQLVLQNCFSTTCDACPELGILNQLPTVCEGFLENVGNLRPGLPDNTWNVIADVASPLGTLTWERILPKLRKHSKRLRSIDRPSLNQTLNQCYRDAIDANADVKALFRRYACCECFLELIARRISCDSRLPGSWYWRIAKRAAPLRFILCRTGSGVRTILEMLVTSHRLKPENMRRHIYADGRPQNGRPMYVLLQPGLLNAGEQMTYQIFTQEVDRCYSAARAGPHHTGVEELLQSAATDYFQQ
ncbi:hypothetical protein BDZ89DRAFT_1047890 [Hymenopellis radicata]|nr:hypothetical protein BDZ89DRAFT_1047890 [Hymenopellis radicata]